MPDPTRIFLAFSDGGLEPVEGALYIRPPAEISDEIPGMVCEQGFKPTADILTQRGFTTVPKATGSFPMALVSLTRSRDENLSNIARAATMVTDGWIVVSGDKTDGIESMLKAVKKRTNVAGVISKSHGKVFWFEKLDAPDWVAAGQMTKNQEGYHTSPGMFSSDRIDPGSALLAEHFPAKLKGEIADLGAGWGYISRKLLERSPDITNIDMYEAEYLSVEAAKQNVDAARSTAIWADVSALTNKKRYDLAFSNPPFHQSRTADPQIGQGFIAAAARILKPSGGFYCVANRQLPYEQIIDATFRHWEILHQDGRYKVIFARRPNTRELPR